MRRSNREITDLNEIISIINDCKVIHLAMLDDGEPYLLPLNFGKEASALFWFSEKLSFSENVVTQPSPMSMPKNSSTVTRAAPA